MRKKGGILYHMDKTIPFDAKSSAKYQGIVPLSALLAGFADCDDFQTRRVSFGLERTEGVTVCWIDGLVSGERVSQDILRPLTEASRNGDAAGDAAVIAQILRGAIARNM